MFIMIQARLYHYYSWPVNSVNDVKADLILTPEGKMNWWFHCFALSTLQVCQTVDHHEGLRRGCPLAVAHWPTATTSLVSYGA